MGGRDKGLIERRGAPLVCSVIEAVTPLSQRVTLLGPPASEPRHDELKARYQARLASSGHEGVCWSSDLSALDERAGAHRALKSALTRAAADWVWVLACDLPLLTTESLRELMTLEPGRLAHLWSAGGRLQPLAGLWSRAALSELGATLSTGAALQSLRSAPWLQVSALVDQRVVMNVNRPEELAALAQLERA